MPSTAPSYSLILLAGQHVPHMRAGLATLAPLLAIGRCEALVVAHRGGVDDLEILRNLLREVGPGARLMPLPPCPAGAARNQAAEQAKGEVLFFSQADCLLPLDLLSRLDEALAPADRDAAAGICRVANRDDPLAMLMGAELAWERQDEQLPDALCAAYRRRDFLEFGGFDPADTAEGLENYELACRLLAQGKELFWDQELQIRRPLPSTWGGCLTLAYQLGRNRFRNLLHRRRLGLGSPGGGRRFAQSVLVMLAVAIPLGLGGHDWQRAVTLPIICLLLLYPLNRGFIKSVAHQEPHLLNRALLWCLLRPWAWTLGMLKAALDRMGGGAN
ncbi:MAG: glycosyltransferase family 2 protein [Desulfarculaceae bacterium]|nr:glycosyltransferase family 2 protein [Desulfarculaceae bacterium]MCF8046141.1 glycosyltransferase family 2 protein [Desulfarculaceae bacterium]MCF8066005.1 glycosyltransferase family 2 protein [Desulfarculaceae bacterium]MCF8097174.1 glycosyltransferase family 2 protein [Desulfarculaceae bacterium]MCF8123255.1 glycosyltransferase family 2 protein [Desulfarculaceae bacterium]